MGGELSRDEQIYPRNRGCLGLPSDNIDPLSLNEIFTRRIREELRREEEAEARRRQEETEERRRREEAEAKRWKEECEARKRQAESERWMRELEYERRCREAREEREREEREEHRKEVKEAQEKVQKAIDEEMEKLQAMERKHEKNIEVWKSKVVEETRKAIVEMEAKAKVEQAEREKKYEDETKLLENSKDQLKEARLDALAILTKGRKDREKLQADYEKHMSQKAKTHKSSILRIKSKLEKYVAEKHSELKILAKSGETLGCKQLEIERSTIAGRQKLLNSMEADNLHDDFRLVCENLRMQFKLFEDAYYTQDEAMVTTIWQMKDHRELIDPPDFEVASEALDSFTKVLDELKVPEAFKDHLDKPLHDIKIETKSVKEVFEEVNTTVDDYQQCLKQTPKNTTKLEECYSKLREIEFDVESSIVRLEVLVDKFQIPVASQMRIEIERQKTALEIAAQEQIKSIKDN